MLFFSTDDLWQGLFNCETLIYIQKSVYNSIYDIIVLSFNKLITNV